MDSFWDKLTTKLFYLLFFLTPLILWPYSSEIFEFNKLVFVYLITILITSSWLIKSLLARKFVFRRTILDIPILVFLMALGASTFLSIDVRTSILGYYSRFHGGFLSYLSYSLLYWAFVSNMDEVKTKKSLFAIILSSIPVLTYGVLEHFGIDKNIWVQDVQNRIFSSLGQPNWLAAWIVAISPVTWVLALKEGEVKQSIKFWVWLLLSSVLFVGLLFTKSRSGFLGFILADLVFWLGVFWSKKRLALKTFVVNQVIFLALAFIIGLPFTQKISAPETGGTESGEIRKIVWKGAINLWKKYPILGTGPETFAYSYYETRPTEHNLVSEWNFLYNKAHNEYLNFASTTGSVGLIAYLFLIVAIIYQIMPRRTDFDSIDLFSWSFLSGFTTILITNFFGFSVVPIALLFFAFPAFAVTLRKGSLGRKEEGEKLKNSTRVFILVVISFCFFGIYHLFRYWYADSLYAKGRNYNSAQMFIQAREFLGKAVSLSPKEPVYWDELSKSSSSLAVLLHEAKETEKSLQLANYATKESDQATSLSPRNLNFQRTKTAVYERLSEIDPSYLLTKIEVLNRIISLAPTDASLYYGLGLTEERIGQREEAIKNLDKAIELKANYKNARFAKALILIEARRAKEAKAELAYILEKIDPNDNLVKEEFEKLK